MKILFEAKSVLFRPSTGGTPTPQLEPDSIVHPSRAVVTAGTSTFVSSL
jgi:hypothetical protein